MAEDTSTVRLLCKLYQGGYPHAFQPGTELAVPVSVAAELLAAGHAEPVTAEPPPATA